MDSIAEATYVSPGTASGSGVNDETLTDKVPGDPITYHALFDIFVYGIDNTGGSDPTLFVNNLALIGDGTGGTSGVANLRFTWYTGAFGVLTSTTAASDLEFSLAANPTFFDASNRLVGCAGGGSPCASPGSTPATWRITDANGVLNNSTVFFNYLSTGFATLLVTGSIIEPAGGGYVNIISTSVIPVSVIPVPAAVWLFGSALIGLIGYGRRRKAA